MVGLLSQKMAFTPMTPDKLTSISRRTALRGLLASGVAISGIGTAAAQQRGNGKNNGNAGDTGNYRATYAYDAEGGWYGENMSDLGQTDGTVGSIDELDQGTLTICHYVIQYGGTFGNDPYLDSGWIKNNIRCEGYESGNYNTIYVSENDVRYTGTREPIWGTWEIFVDTRRGNGNVADTADPRPSQ